MTPAGSLRPLRKTVPAQWAAITVAVLLLLFLLSVCLRHLAAQSHERRCYTRMMRVGQALRLYVEDYDGTWPVMDDWWQAQRDNPELADGCPAARRLPPFPHGPRFTSAIHGYAFNAVLSYKDERGGGSRPYRQSDIRFPQLTVSVCEQASDVVATRSPDPFSESPVKPKGREEGFRRHRGGAHYLFCDGHAKWLLPSDVKGVAETFNGPSRHEGKMPSFEL